MSKRKCSHSNAERGAIYDYCPDCGGVRRAATVGRPADSWHSCSDCQPREAPTGRREGEK